MKNKLSGEKFKFIFLGLIIGIVVTGGFMSRSNNSLKGISKVVKSAIDNIKYWTCSMHPQIKLLEPGKCPICAMDLIPVKEGDNNLSEYSLTMSEHAKKIAKIQTTKVQRKFVEAKVRLVGKVDYDETRLAYITAWVSGRIDRLFVDYTGVSVDKGDHLVEIYSPELLSAQEEYLQALKSVVDVEKSHLDVIKETTQDTLTNVLEKLKLLGITDEQIEDIKKNGVVSEQMVIYSPIGGIVISKEVKEGTYVKTGTRIYTIADLSSVWIKLDVYESELNMLKYGQKVEFETESYPGEIFRGKIAFIDPILNEATRTVKVRVNVDNSRGKLKPGMFVRAVVKVSFSTNGVVVGDDLLGKSICPMHPEIVKDEKSRCDICGMELKKAEDLGYVSKKGESLKAPLVIPVTVPLITGKRAVVYVELTGTDEPTFEGREVVLGHRVGDYYIVKKGLEEGEKVVTQGNFKIDSALQLEAKPSMMNPHNKKNQEGSHH